VANFKPSDEREYEHWKLPRTRRIMQYNDVEKKVEWVDAIVDCVLIECVTKERKVYQHLKKFYANFEATSELNVLPTEEQLTALQNELGALTKDVIDE
jgi:hypothetical protein